MVSRAFLAPLFTSLRAFVWFVFRLQGSIFSGPLVIWLWHGVVELNLAALRLSTVA